MRVVKGHILRQDLAHDDNFCVPGDIEKLCSNQRIAVVGLKRKYGKRRCVRNFVMSVYLGGTKGRFLMCVPRKTRSDVTARVGSAMVPRVHWGKYVSTFRTENWSGGDGQY